MGFIIDPYESVPIIEFAKNNNIKIQAILNTHLHADHTRGNQHLIDTFECPVIFGPIPSNLNSEIKIDAHSTPGHCSEHYVYSFNAEHFFMGDLLFQGGVGRCQSGGDPTTLANSLKKIIKLTPANAQWYPGHDYWNKNYAFASQYNFFQKQIAALPKHVQGELTHNTLEFEKEHNIFLWSLDLKNWEKIQHPIKGNSPLECFINLRKTKDKFKNQ